MVPSDERLARILLETRAIAMLGAPEDPAHPDYGLGCYMTRAGYRVIPVAMPGKCAEAEAASGRVPLEDIGGSVDLLSVSGAATDMSERIHMAVARLCGLRTIWLQPGVDDGGAGSRAGVTLVAGRCIRAEHARLIGGASRR